VSNIGIYQQKFIGLITNGDYVPIIQFRDVLAHAAAVSQNNKKQYKKKVGVRLKYRNHHIS
jgi:hypothetical protein